MIEDGWSPEASFCQLNIAYSSILLGEERSEEALQHE
jgi:hypothetical protein